MSKPCKPAPKSTAKAGTNAKPRASKAKPVKLLSAGNPHIAGSGGDVPVQAHIAAMPGRKSGIGRRRDAPIVRRVVIS